MTMIDEKEIRTALRTKAHEVEVPSGLATETLEAIDPAKPRLRDRFRIRFRIRPVRGFPRWMYATAAAALVILLFGLGTVVTRAPRPQQVASKGVPITGPVATPPPTQSDAAP